ncbi:MAG: cellulose biosynthesis cyclic di-GMP-binding regulatory protein BcsB [Chloroflexota bacterium]
MNWKVFVIGLLVVVLLMPVSAAADAPEKSNLGSTQAYIQIGDNQAVVTFEELGYQQTDLISPFDSTRVFFSIPANWRLAAGGQVELNFDTLLSGADVDQVGESDYGGALTVRFNGKRIGTIRLGASGNTVVRLDLPADALASRRRDGRHELEVILNAQFSCNYDIRTVVSIRTASLFDLPFAISSPALDLAALPQPFYLRDSLLPDRTLIVIPDNPATGEMKAAFDVIAGFGSMVGVGFDFDLLPVSNLTEELLTSTNLIFVGQPGQFPMLADIKFPTAVQGNQFVNLASESAEDGIIQLALSPWNASKVVLLVSGTTEAAVVKAAQAVSSGRIFIFDKPDVSYVKSVSSFSSAIPVVEDFTVKDLGYTTQTMSSIGSNSIDFTFHVSKEQVNTEDAYLDLAFFHSGLLDFAGSSLSVSLNDQLMASAVLSEATQQMAVERMLIPPGMLRYGTNRMSISAKLLPAFGCDVTGASAPWLTVSDTTSLHIPVAPASTSSASLLLDLRFYPEMLITQSDLGDVAFVLPRANPATWQIAADLAYDLGRLANPSISNLGVVFADEPASEIHGQSSLIVVGRASTLPILTEFNDILPAPFDLASDTAEETNMQIVYRIPPGVSVGYLELMASPYNSQKVVLVVSGNDDPGLAKSGAALLVGELRGQLAGLFAVTNGTQVATRSSNSIYSVIGTVVPGVAATVATPISSGQSPQAVNYARPVWLMPLIAASVVGIILLMIFVSISAISRNRARPAAQEEEKPTQKNGRGKQS